MHALAKFLSLSILDWAINRQPLTVAPETPVIDVMVLMQGLGGCTEFGAGSAHDRIDCVVVVAGLQVVGLFTQFDVVRLLASGMDLKGVTIDAVMTQPTMTLKQSDQPDVFAVLSAWRQHPDLHLPVVNDQGQLVGLVASKNICWALSKAANSCTGFEEQVQIQEHQQAEATLREQQSALQQAKEQLQAVLDAVPGFVSWVSSELRYIGVNQQLATHFNLSPEAFVGQELGFLQSSPQFADFMGQFMARSERAASQVIEAKGNGTRHYLLAAQKYQQGNAAVSVGIDITEHKQAEAALRESERRFRAIFNQTYQLIGLLLPDGTLLEANQTALDFIGVGHGDVVGRLLWDTPWWNSSPEIQHALKAAIAQAAAGEFVRYQVDLPDANGIMVTFDFSLKPVFDETGQVVLLIPESRDITELKRMQKERDRFFKHSLDLMAVVDSNGYLKQLNRAWEKTLGYPVEELEGRPYIALIHSEDLEGIDPIARAFETGQPVTACENRYRCKDGSYRWLSWNTVPFVVEGLVYGFAHDISSAKQAEAALQRLNEDLEIKVEKRTAALKKLNQQLLVEVGDRKQAEQALQQAKDQLQAVLDAVPGLVSWISSDLRYLGVNQHLAKSFSHTPEAFVDQEIGFLESSPGFAEFIRYFFADNATQTFKEVTAQVEGAVRSYLIVAQKYQQGAAAVSIGIDITDRKQLEEELRQTLEKEKELGELKSRFITMTSHEFRTPLSTILSSSELLEHYRHKWTEEKQLTHLRRIQTAVKHMTQMLNDVLTIGKAEAGKLEFNPASLNLVAYCCQLVEELKLSTGNRYQITFVVKGEQQDSAANDMPPVYMDEKLLRHILSNLLSNAIKYSPVNSTIQFALTYQQGSAVFQVQDRGIGIPPEDIPRLFESFHRATNVGNIQGTGLGLTIVQKCVAVHQGAIAVVSEVGVGTTFTVTLPLGTRASVHK